MENLDATKYNYGNKSLPISRPAPVFFRESQSLSTKKARRTPKCAAPPPAPVKSCPVTRIFTKVNKDEYKPQPVTFKNDTNTSFISQSQLYSSKKCTSYFQQCFIIHKRLGVGSFGEVFQVRSREDKKLYACKRTLLRFRGEKDRRRRVAEVQKHESLPLHPNCVRLYRAWEEHQHLYLLTELCHKSLADLAEDKHELPESMIWSYLVDLLRGLDHLHKHKLVHMDVKPENIFIGLDGLCKLGDFGLVLDLSKEDSTEAIEGDPRYLAPECLRSQFSCSVDLFSLGLTILELATDLDLPKQGKQWHILRSGCLPDVAFNLSLELQNILLGLLQPDPALRLSAETALQFPIIQKTVKYKTIQYNLHKGVVKVQSLLSILWFWITVAVSALTLPIKTLGIKNWGSAQTKEQSYLKDFSDMDYLSHSDEEGDDQILAQPLNDTNSSGESYLSRPLNLSMVNSTPLLHHSAYNRNRFLQNCVNSRSTASRRPRPYFNENERGLKKLNEIDLSEIHLEESPIRLNSSNSAIHSDYSPPAHATSKNLMDLFNAADSDDDL